MDWLFHYDTCFFENITFFWYDGKHSYISQRNYKSTCFLFQRKYLNGQFYVEVKNQRQRLHPAEDNILGVKAPLKPLRTQYKVQIGTHIRKNKKFLKLIIMN